MSHVTHIQYGIGLGQGHFGDETFQAIDCAGAVKDSSTGAIRISACGLSYFLRQVNKMTW